MFLIILFLISFIRTLLFLGLIVLGIRWLSILLSPKSKASKSYDAQQNKTREGELTITYSKPTEKIIGKDKGEYVTFEESDDR